MKIDDIKIGVLVPTRGDDRKIFLLNVLRMIDAQTVRPHVIEIVGEAPKSNECDITYRYRTGYEKLCSKVDVIFFWEDDDWYSPQYIETMLQHWDGMGRPDLFGTRYTIYYHLKLRKKFTMKHESRASAMNTMLKTNLKIHWPKDNDPYTDAYLWFTQSHLKKKLFTPPTVISVGMKHGIGMCGGKNHVDNLQRYNDEGLEFLKTTLDEKSFEFYNGLFADNHV
jgi:hypothetical protein